MNNNFPTLLLFTLIFIAFGCNPKGNTEQSGKSEDIPPLVDDVKVRNAKIVKLPTVDLDRDVNCLSATDCVKLCTNDVLKDYELIFELLNNTASGITLNSIEAGVKNGDGSTTMNTCKGETGMNTSITAGSVLKDTLSLCFVKTEDLNSDSIVFKLMMNGNANPTTISMPVCQ